MSTSRDGAIDAIQKWIDLVPTPSEENKWSERNFYQERLDMFKKGYKRKGDEFGYVIEERDVDEVLVGEIS